MSSAERSSAATPRGCSISKSPRPRARMIAQWRSCWPKPTKRSRQPGRPKTTPLPLPRNWPPTRNRLTNIENRLVGVESRLVQVENRLDHVESRLDHIESRLAVVESKVAALAGEVAALAGKINVLTWAVGINTAATIAILGVLLRGHGPLP